MVILSPTPPVECLSTNASGLPSRRRSAEVQPLAGVHHRRRPAGDLGRRHPAQEDRHQQRRHLLVGHPAVGVGVDHPVDRRVRQHAAVALGPDDRRRVECELGHGVSRPAAVAPGQIVRARTRRAAGRPAAAARADGRSASPGRRAPAAPAGTARTASAARPSASTHDSAISRPPPLECRAQTTAHSAQRPRPYETFSTLQPATIRRVVDQRRSPDRRTPNTARRRNVIPQLPCTAMYSSRYRTSYHPRQADSECIPKPRPRSRATI